ncbi:dihydrolipoyl dehydrogenase ['Elaeagnus angustifolia' witches'-broom phytoplasma]|uniref:Dihydrolipoyl dehydrogenase n=1 Tax='Elaeagnus angustifolia' witches'-broom phytoplasma TaxID=1538355 RepID=A0ABS5V930_9MOLU|nr:dihydrolipoyl dehydrogenase ['Elaeagnus angustifolia' witches'-broom phytoplasma]MCX2955680.1 dihydrolipoyl dehydrogenase [Candidatus Phytoplasma australiense]
MKNYDVLVIGGGPGGYVAAIKAAQMGAKVALVEKHKLGGICLNYGCIPTKAYLKSAKMYKDIKRYADFGIKVQNGVSFDWSSILSRKNKIVAQLTTGISFLLKKNKIDFYHGFASVLSPCEVQVDTNLLHTQKLIIATGSTAFVPPIPGAQEAYQKGILKTSKELLQLESYPSKVTIVGGGVIGVEFATIFNSFGSEVTILERQDTILNGMDRDVVVAYTKKLQADGIQILTQVEVTKINDNQTTYTQKGNAKTITSDVILMAVGTKANLAGLEKLNLALNRNSVQTDNFCQTSIPGVYAIGDVNGKHMLAHVASHEGIVAVTHALEQKAHPINYDRVPACIYGFPEIASIGMTEQQAKEKQMDYKVSKISLGAVGKSLADGEKEGFAKLIVCKKHLEILGMHIYAYNATELISEMAVGMELEGTAYELSQAIHPHPTLSELTFEALLGAVDKPIHA